jgi:hypothetical protein
MYHVFRAEQYFAFQKTEDRWQPAASGAPLE